MDTDLAAGGTSARERCTRRLVPTVNRNAKYPSSPPRTGRCTARIASLSTGSPGFKTLPARLAGNIRRRSLRIPAKSGGGNRLIPVSITHRRGRLIAPEGAGGAVCFCRRVRGKEPAPQGIARLYRAISCITADFGHGCGSGTVDQRTGEVVY